MPSKNDFIIRDYQPEDYHQIVNLWQETGLGDTKRGDKQKVIEQTIKHGGKFLVLIYKPANTIIGTSWLTNDFRRIYLHHFCIKPEFQGKGLSHLLMKKSMEFVKHQKKQIKLEVHKTNKKAINLYEKWGFKNLGDYLVMIVRDVENISKIE